MTFFEKAKRLLVYGGLTREQFAAVEPDIIARNLRNLGAYTVVGIIIFALLSIASLTIRSYAYQNHPIYLAAGLAMAFLALGAWLVAPKHLRLVIPLVWLFEVALYAFALGLAATHPEFPSLSIIVFLAVIPLLVVDRPINVASLTVASAAVACIVSTLVKPPEVAWIDYWDITTYVAFALAANIVVMSTKLKAMNQTREIAYLSTIDTLTGTRNRNSYEHVLDESDELGKPGAICVYVDANGLHALNNAKGHDAGDEMLRAIAEELRRLFGDEWSFRTGGDEFVAFSLDETYDQVESNVSGMQARLAEQGYHLSCGVAEVDEDEAEMRPAIRRAEQCMYVDKAAFYQAIGSMVRNDDENGMR